MTDSTYEWMIQASAFADLSAVPQAPAVSDGRVIAQISSVPPASAPTVMQDIAVTCPHGLYACAVKRLVDIVVATVIGVLLLPVLISIWLAARVSSGGPGIFPQERVGHHGKHFTVYKLRTMVDDPDGERAKLRPNADGRIVHKIADDPRITRSGRFLRKWSLDELPQLWNVLRGDMSLVGPRPELPQITAHYEPWQHRRHHVRPGMTGLWQVSARSDGLMHECVELDVEYVTRLSLRTDLRILAVTPLAALGRRTGI